MDELEIYTGTQTFFLETLTIQLTDSQSNFSSLITLRNESLQKKWYWVIKKDNKTEDYFVVRHLVSNVVKFLSQLRKLILQITIFGGKSWITLLFYLFHIFNMNRSFICKIFFNFFQFLSVKLCKRRYIKNPANF